MRTGFCNLVWPLVDESVKTALIGSATICDFAPTIAYGSWSRLPHCLPHRPFGDSGPEISALQSLFYGVQGASLVRDDESFEILKQHFYLVVASAKLASARAVIFGSPGTRKDWLRSVSRSVVLGRLRQLADICGCSGILLCFEVNSRAFGCELLSSWSEYCEFLAAMDHPAIGTHVDVGQLLQEGLDPCAVISGITGQVDHVHLSNRNYGVAIEDALLYANILSVVSKRHPSADVTLEIQRLAQTEVELFSELAEMVNCFGESEGGLS